MVLLNDLFLVYFHQCCVGVVEFRRLWGEVRCRLLSFGVAKMGAFPQADWYRAQSLSAVLLGSLFLDANPIIVRPSLIHLTTLASKWTAPEDDKFLEKAGCLRPYLSNCPRS